MDSGSTNHMTFDRSLLQASRKPYVSHVSNANGVSSIVTSAETIILTPSLSLEHTLFILSLSNNLLYVSQVIEKSNCLVIIYPYFCIFEDLNKKEIIGRGTKKGGFIMWMMNAIVLL